MELSGSLKEFGIAGLLQVVESEGKTGVLKVISGDETGSIFVKDGKMVHASSGDLSGEEAFYKMSFWEEGHFSFHSNEDPPRRTIFRSNRTVLLEAVCRADELKRWKEKIPSVDVVPVIKASRDEGRIPLDTMEWKILSKINGSRNIKGIAEQAGVSEHVVMKVVYSLLEAHIILLQNR